MSKKQYIMDFIVMFIPMLIASFLLNLLYSLEFDNYVHINLFFVISFAIFIDAFVTWMQHRKNGTEKPE
jgi:hypothetical protein